jgi:Tfp pilus assembly protein PilN
VYKVNLLPPELTVEERRPSLTERLPAVAWYAVAVVVVLGYSAFLFTYFIAQGDLERKQAALERLAPEVAAAQALAADLKSAEARLVAWREVLINREDWVYLLEEVGAKLPAEVWFTALSIVPGLPEQTGTAAETAALLEQAGGEGAEAAFQPPVYTMQIEGGSRTLPAVGVFVHHLQRMPQFSSVTLREIREDGDGNLSFAIDLKLVGSDGHAATAE